MGREYLRTVNDLIKKDRILLTDSQILVHVEKYSGGKNSIFFEKILLVKDALGRIEIVSGNFVHEVDYHAQIALLYMKNHDLSKIEICGGGEIKMKDGKFEIDGTSEQFSCMSSKILRDTANTKFGNKVCYGATYTAGTRTEFKTFSKTKLEKFILELN